MNKWVRWMANALTLLASAWAFCFLTPLLSDGCVRAASEEVSEGGSQQVLLKTSRQQLQDLTDNNRLVLHSYDNMIKNILNLNAQGEKISTKDLQKICAAVLFAAKQHKNQVRKNPEKTPYICYPLDMTSDLIKIGGVQDPDVIMGSILHDTVAGNQAVLREIHKQFGSQVAGLVREVSSYPISAQSKHQRMLLAYAPKQSQGATQIDLADLLYSLNELSVAPPSSWKKEQIDHYFEWAQTALERFPEANAPLQVAAEKAIQAYWDRQSVKGLF